VRPVDLDNHGDPAVDPWDLAHEPEPFPAPAADADKGTDDWPTPKPLISFADPLPIDACGPILAPLVRAAAYTNQVPTDMVITMGLSLINLVTLGRWIVQVTPSWRETLPLATISIVESSGGKSGTLEELAEPVHQFEQDKIEQVQGTIRVEEARHTMLSDQVDTARLNAKKARAKTGPGSDGAVISAETAYQEAVAKLAEHVVPTEPVLMTSDITQEALARDLQEQKSAMAIVSDESSAIMSNLAGRYSSGNVSLETVLNANSGRPISIRRKGSPPVKVRRPNLTMCLAVQPGMMTRLAGDRPEFRDSGFLGRFLAVYCESLMGHRDTDATNVPVPDEVREGWHRAVRALADEAWKLREADEFRTITLHPDAYDAIQAFRRKIEPWFLEGPLAEMRDFGGKLHGQAVRMAAGRTLFDNPRAEEITGAAMADAITLVEGFIPHAQSVFALIGGKTPAIALTKVRDYLRERGETPVQHRALHQVLKDRGPFARKSADLKALMETLEALDWVKKDQRPAGAKGGTPSTWWHVSPHVWQTRPGDLR
jgi:hypothetical protein